jgi:hypothetical protein
LTQSALSDIDTHNNFYFFLEVRYTLTATGSGTVNSFTLNYTKGTATLTPEQTLHPDILCCDGSSFIIKDTTYDIKIVPVIDASLLNGYPGSWYLDRSHHKGYQPISSIMGLQAIINDLFAIDASIHTDAINIGDGSAGVFAGIDASNRLKFREFVGSGNLIVEQIGDLIVIHLDTSANTFYSASNIHGGDASVFHTKTSFNDFEFKELKSVDPSVLSIISDSSYVYFQIVASPFDVLDGGDGFSSSETDSFQAFGSDDVLEGGSY